MMDRVGQLWEIGDSKSVGPDRLLVTKSDDLDNGRTRQHYIFFKGDKKAGTGDDIEYGDFPWENRSERRRLA